MKIFTKNKFIIPLLIGTVILTSFSPFLINKGLADNVMTDENIKAIAAAAQTYQDKCVEQGDMSCTCSVVAYLQDDETVDDYRASLKSINLLARYSSICADDDIFIKRLNNYNDDPSPENLGRIIRALGTGSMETENCLTDEQVNTDHQDWLTSIKSHSPIQKAINDPSIPESCRTEKFTFECLTLFPAKIRSLASSYDRAESAPIKKLGPLYREYADVLEAFIRCPTQANFDILDAFCEECVHGEEKDILEENRKFFTGDGTNPLGNAIQKLVRLLIWSIQPSSYGGYTTNNVGVKIVWEEMRKLVNIGLIIAMILMAMATILGIEKYSWKNTLWKIALVALLVNFSLVIVGMIVDLFNYFTVFFLNSTISNIESFGSLFSFSEGLNLSVLEALTGFLQWLLSNLIIFFVGLLVIIILLVAFLAMIIRAIAIMFLAIIAPLAFAAWIFPGTEKWWKMWWENFLKWVSFGLLFSISLYIGMTVVSAIQYQNIEITDISLFNVIITSLMAAVFLLVGLIFSLQSGTAASQFILKQTGKIGGAVGGWAGRKTKERVTESAFYKRTGLKLAKSRIPFVRGGGQRMVIGGEKAKKERIKKHEKDYENLSLTALLDATKGGIPSPSLDREGFEERIAITNILARMGKLNKESIDFIRKYKNDDRLDQKAIAEAVPQAFHFEDGKFVETGSTVSEKAIALADMKPSKIENIQGSDYIEDSVAEASAEASAKARKDAYNQAKASGETEEKAREAAEKAAEAIAEATFNNLIQEIFRSLRPEQLAAFYKSISPKDMDKNGWGGETGKIVIAIKADKDAKVATQKALDISRPLRSHSGLIASDLN